MREHITTTIYATLFSTIGVPKGHIHPFVFGIYQFCGFREITS
jgi:hypothetical protein